MQRERERERNRERNREISRVGYRKIYNKTQRDIHRELPEKAYLTQTTELRTRDCNRDDHSRVKNDLGDRTGITAPDLSPRDESGTLTLYSCTL